VQVYKDILTKIGVLYNSNYANIKITNLNTTGFEFFNWKYFLSTDQNHIEEVKLFKQIIEILVELNECIKQKTQISPKLKDSFLELDVNGVRSIAKNAIEYFGKNNYYKIVQASLTDQDKTYPAVYNNYSTKKLFEMCGAYKPIMKIEPLPNTIEMEDKKLLGKIVTSKTGERYSVQKIMNLVDKPNSEKALLDTLNKLSPEDREVIEKELVLKLAYTYIKDINKNSAVSGVVGAMSSEFQEQYNRCITYNPVQIKAEEVKLTGGLLTLSPSYLDEIVYDKPDPYISESYLY